MSKADKILLCGFLALVGNLVAPPAVNGDFLRGDANRSGSVNISDAVIQLLHLFGSNFSLPCEDAADLNDDGRLDIVDPIITLGFLFERPRLSLPSPGPSVAGPDPTCDRLGCADSPEATPAVVINEIYYQGRFYPDAEFVELHNRADVEIDLAGYRFTDGINFNFPDDARLPPGGFTVVARNPSRWRNPPLPVLGPFEGTLSDRGERLTVHDGDCKVESVRYDDRPPWPIRPDGYGVSLERIDPRAPAGDFHSWRASNSSGGSTLGETNSTLDVPTHPVLALHSINPPKPRSSDAVTAEITLDVPSEAVGSAVLRFQSYTGTDSSAVESAAMELRSGGDAWSVFAVILPARPSQTLVRFNVEVTLADGRSVLLPSTTDFHPYVSYFVHDFEIEALMPIMWVFGNLPVAFDGKEETRSDVIFLEPGATTTEIFADVRLRNSTNGQKVRFLKGEEYRGDRTVNLIPETGGGSGAGVLANQMEHLGFQTYRDLGALAPRADWYRIIQIRSTGVTHTQNLLIQQVNERFLAMNGIDDDGDLFKLDKSLFSKKTHPETGSGALADLRRAISSGDLQTRRQGVFDKLDLDSVGRYSLVSMLIENWDGFHNNLYIYNDLSPGGRWIVIPWDLDQLFQPGHFDFPVTWPIDGRPVPGASYNTNRYPGPISRPYHMQADLDAAYRQAIRDHIRPGGPFTVESMNAKMTAIEAMLLDDLTLQEKYMGTTRDARRSAIISSYATMRQYMDRRIPYLESILAQ